MSESMDRGQPILQCKGLSKSYHDGTTELEVLKGIDLSIYRGDSIAIVGASGSGKSTLLHLLGGLDHSSEGVVLIGGENIHQQDEKKRSRIRNRQLGFIYQFHHLLSEFSALENVAMPLLIAGKDSLEAKACALEMLTAVGLAQRVAHKPGELSGGERQRVAIARAMVTKPACILADEPTGNLDEDSAEKICTLLLNLTEEYATSLVMVTHNLAIAGRMKRTIYLRQGVLDLGETPLVS